MDIVSISLMTPLSQTQVQTPPPEHVQDQREMISAVRAINASEMFGQDNELTFVMDRQSRRAIVRIVNRKTGEIVKQIPPEYVLRMAEEIRER